MTTQDRPWPGSIARRAMWLIIAAVLLFPLIAMRFTTEVNWSAADFAIAAVLLVGAGLAYEVAARTLVDRRHRLMAGGAIAALVMLIWAEGAVGIL